MSELSDTGITIEISHEDSECVIEYLLQQKKIGYLQLRQLSNGELQELIRANYKDAIRSKVNTSGKIKGQKLKLDAERLRAMQQLLGKPGKASGTP